MGLPIGSILGKVIGIVVGGGLAKTGGEDRHNKKIGATGIGVAGTALLIIPELESLAQQVVVVVTAISALITSLRAFFQEIKSSV